MLGDDNYRWKYGSQFVGNYWNATELKPYNGVVLFILMVVTEIYTADRIKLHYIGRVLIAGVSIFNTDPSIHSIDGGWNTQRFFVLYTHHL
jgi:hypothetical protein